MYLFEDAVYVPIGSEGGLKLQLNIEQYQYMHGPNEGAGLKVLVHNYNEIPLVRDHGLAIPPGSHAFIAAKTVKVSWFIRKSFNTA